MKFDPKQLKSVAGTFPTGVTIVTITEASGEVHGMTASSLQSVSLDPPLVSFCERRMPKRINFWKREHLLASAF